MQIKERLNEISNNIKSFATADDIKLVAVTKYADDAQVIEAEKLGVKIFGENYVGPALEKIKRLTPYFTNKVEWHLTGTLQKNKVNKAVGNFSLIQSIDSIELLEKVDARSKSMNIKQDVLIQINISNSPTKHGFSKEDFETNISKILSFENVSIKGLMTMFEHGQDSESLEKELQIMNNLKILLKSFKPENEFELSMGMSGDYCAALKGGASMIRIGRALFG
ncbi:MAG: YggS family pyridoxal phosphate-dependent enzyme [Candidatus Caenarcaniphilales bacterium]|nr:YggS family pyridoxal phosphate-dependent enzyme [Candidatus Caenarcaniphilales bacterium]